MGDENNTQIYFPGESPSHNTESYLVINDVSYNSKNSISPDVNYLDDDEEELLFNSSGTGGKITMKSRVAYYKSKLWKISFGGGVTWFALGAFLLIAWFLTWVIGTIIAFVLGISVVGLIFGVIFAGLLYVVGGVCGFLSTVCFVLGLIFFAIAFFRCCFCRKTATVDLSVDDYNFNDL
eukprot:TRINITY_DN16448_c0_g1_i1.p1 TRINITY_DN16448_c0_g1~~TRINITY_DN16448_c0_g1_i1.p1  ORF type:complete len:179 (+),score=56.10 TRINITY_DN16448_c0_g1_i1:155-691(+)